MIEFKQQMREISEMDDLQLSGLELDTIVENMLIHLGSPDMELRDVLIYSTFARLISRKYLEPETLIHLLETCTDDEHLFYCIEENPEDSVFLRSFSALIVALILDLDETERFLTDEMAREACERAVDYLLKEEDLQGFVEVKGWAHAVAHGADLLGTAAKHPTIDIYRFYPVCLEAIRKCVLREDGVYTDNEDERLIIPIEIMLDNGLQKTQLQDWIASLCDKLDEKRMEGMSNAFFHLRTNVTNFLQTLYFRLLFKQTASSCRKTIEEQLKKNYEVLYQPS